MIRLALYQPDIPGNVGAAIRLCAGLGVPLDVIEPCGFPWDERKIKAAAMDYIQLADMTRHNSWEAFQASRTAGRLILLTTQAALPYTDFSFQPGDVLIAGRESAGVPESIHNAADHRVTIQMAEGARSFNVINACAMVMGEALRQSR